MRHSLGMVISATDTLDRSRMCSSIYQGIVLCVLPAPPARRLRMTRGPVAPAAQRRHLAPPLRLQVKGLYQILVKVTVAVAVLSSESHADCRCLKALVRETPPSRPAIAPADTDAAEQAHSRIDERQSRAVGHAEGFGEGCEAQQEVAADSNVRAVGKSRTEGH